MFKKITTVLAAAVVLCSCESALPESVWASREMWYEAKDSFEADDVDVLYLVSTEVLSAQDSDGGVSWRSQLTAEDKASMEAEIAWVEKNMFSDGFNVSAPYYHQLTFDAISTLDKDSFAGYYNAVAKEACDAFDYYMEHMNNGRNFILAGFSQGAMLCLDLLRHMSDEQYGRMVACYSVGYRLSAEDLQHPHIKAARGADDRGVVVSFNSTLSREAIWPLVGEGAVTCINPLNWKTDSTPADFTFDGTNNTASIDPETNVILVNTDNPEYYHSFYELAPFFLDAGVLPDNLHHWDLQFYASQIHDNALLRARRHTPYLASIAGPEGREIRLLDEGWQFTRDEQTWKTVSVPHDWAIEGPFDMNIDAQTVKVVEDGERVEKLRTGRTGSLPFIGTGCYKIDLGRLDMRSGRVYRLEFDGAMSNAKVYVNGSLAGERPYGYSSFAIDVTSHLKKGRHNMVEVRLENKPESSRWYPGAGLYRNVRLVSLDPVHVAHWGTYVTTPSVSETAATVSLKTTIENETGAEGINLETSILSPEGVILASSTTPLGTDAVSETAETFEISSPELWDIESPTLYTVVSRIISEDKVLDKYTTDFGIRTYAFDPDGGFSLNGRRVPLQGVCLHHDLGPLGAAVNTRAIERQLEMMKEMGCNAIRTSHNPPAPEMLDLCDRMGFLVMDESFDEWRMPKNKNGYSQFFDEWAETDLVGMIHRDRNHPSIIIWSIGNEIREQGSPTGAETARFLTDICHREDPTRPVTAGLNNYVNALKNGFGEVVDLVGLNYKPFAYAKEHADHPEYRIYASETASTVSSRGKYHFPVEETSMPMHSDFHCSSYDLEYPSWASTPDTEFSAQDDNPFVAGEFVWTGFDYLGEPTPYNETTSSRSSYFGIIDLAGLKKDRFYLYQSRWSDVPVLHLLPHWNWNEGDVLPVHCYTNHDEVELFLNGESLGRRSKDATSRLNRHRLVWDAVRYEPGELKAVAYAADGSIAGETVVRTAGAPHHLVLAADRPTIAADGNDLSFVEISVVDENGVLCPDAEIQLDFSTSGIGLVALCNGDPTSLESFTGTTMKTFSGKCVAVVGKTRKAHKGTLHVSSPELGLKETLKISTQYP